MKEEEQASAGTPAKPKRRSRAIRRWHKGRRREHLFTSLLLFGVRRPLDTSVLRNKKFVLLAVPIVVAILVLALLGAQWHPIAGLLTALGAALIALPVLGRAARGPEPEQRDTPGD